MRMRNGYRVLVALLAASMMLPGLVAVPATAQSRDVPPPINAADCGEWHNFAREPVPVAKAADGTVLATVFWEYNADVNLCYLTVGTDVAAVWGQKDGEIPGTEIIDTGVYPGEWANNHNSSHERVPGGYIAINDNCTSQFCVFTGRPLAVGYLSQSGYEREGGRTPKWPTDQQRSNALSVARKCGYHYDADRPFGQDGPIPIANWRTEKGVTVPASFVMWGYNESLDLCYLRLDEGMTQYLRLRRQAETAETQLETHCKNNPIVRTVDNFADPLNYTEEYWLANTPPTDPSNILFACWEWQKRIRVELTSTGTFKHSSVTYGDGNGVEIAIHQIEYVKSTRTIQKNSDQEKVVPFYYNPEIKKSCDTAWGDQVLDHAVLRGSMDFGMDWGTVSTAEQCAAELTDALAHLIENVPEMRNGFDCLVEHYAALAPHLDPTQRPLLGPANNGMTVIEPIGDFHNCATAFGPAGTLDPNGTLRASGKTSCEIIVDKLVDTYGAYLGKRGWEIVRPDFTQPPQPYRYGEEDDVECLGQPVA